MLVSAPACRARLPDSRVCYLDSHNLSSKARGKLARNEGIRLGRFQRFELAKINSGEPRNHRESKLSTDTRERGKEYRKLVSGF